VHAITVLPTVSSLKALSELTKESHASEPYIGFVRANRRNSKKTAQQPNSHVKRDETRRRTSR
jgi:hypothetical protein